ncbi:hypothetical protein [Pseudomonas citrulli]|uniref:Uncharacterized protein n=1 Tax=Pseudomonas citrulli TaxID=3064347 RepID=A0ABT9BW27_9PSED|nr:hypothetical protein [Pseudomonas sp. K18]MDO7896760.1 hypothetical protein [Pseudomonas sp. K18]
MELASLSHFTSPVSGRAETPGPSNVDDPRHTIIDMTSIETLSEGIPHEHRTELSPHDLEFAMRGVEDALHQIISERQLDAGTDTERVLEYIAVSIGESTDDGQLTKALLGLGDFEFLKHSLSADQLIQGAQTVLAYLSDKLDKLSRNELEGDLGRWVGNLTTASVRTGMVTGVLTVFRQLAGFAMEKNLQSNATSPLTRSVIGAIALSVGPITNMLGAIRDECNGTANIETRMARLSTLLLSMAALAAAATVPTALPALASLGSQMAFYTFAQDLVSLFCPTGDNAKANLGGTAIAGLLNGALQFVSFTLMNYTAPHSGPGYVMAQGNASSASETEGLAAQLSAWVEQQANTTGEPGPQQTADSLTVALGDDVLRGVYNAFADVSGQILMGEAMHAMQAEPSKDGFRINPISFRIPTAEQAANQFLSTNAIRTSVGQIIVGVVVAASRYFSTLPISKETADHIANLFVAAVVFAARPGTTYVNARTQPA